MLRSRHARGVDGFRMDVINLVSKVVGFPDGPVGPTGGTRASARAYGPTARGCWGADGRDTCFGACTNGPRFHEFLAEMHAEVFDAYPDRTFLTVGETPGIGIDDALKRSDPARGEVDMVFQFEHVVLDNNPGDKFAELLLGIARVNRDNPRTPMLWSGAEGAGFTSGEPWLVINPAAGEINASAQVGVAGSVFEFYRILIALRRTWPVLVSGDFDLLPPSGANAEHPSIWAVRRTLGNETLTALANFFREATDVPEQW